MNAGTYNECWYVQWMLTCTKFKGLLSFHVICMVVWWQAKYLQALPSHSILVSNAQKYWHTSCPVIPFSLNKRNKVIINVIWKVCWQWHTAESSSWTMIYLNPNTRYRQMEQILPTAVTMYNIGFGWSKIWSSSSIFLELCCEVVFFATNVVETLRHSIVSDWVILSFPECN